MATESKKAIEGGGGGGGAGVRAGIDFTAGLVGGVLECLSCHPLDTTKVAMQNAPPSSRVGMVETIVGIARKRGVLGLYAGVQSPLAGLAAINAVLFASFSWGCSVVARDDQTVIPGQLSLGQIVAAGALTGLPLTPIESVVDLLKIQLQARPDYAGFGDALRRLVVSHPRSVFQGMWATLLRDVPANGAYFGAYIGAKRVLLTPEEAAAEINSSDLPAVWKILAAGGFGGSVFWAVALPFDAVKTIIQGQSLDPSKHTHSSYASAARYVYRSGGGLAGFFRGWQPTMLKSAPSNAVCFLGYELTRKVLEKFVSGVDDVDAAL